MEKLPLFLSEADELSAVREPLKRSSRIKYTCFNASQNYLVFGASSGGLYIFHREPCSFIQLLPSTNGSVTHVSISPCESLVAFSTVKGSVSVVGFQSTSAPRFKRTSHEHDGFAISTLQWSARSSELYIGDATGRVSVLGLLFYMLSHVTLMQLDSRIVQMDWHYHLLLVSTLSRSYLCDTIHEQYRQIGSQLRDGFYGACFYNFGDEDLSIADVDRDTTRSSMPFSSLRKGEKLLADDRLRNVKIYCARPGLRLWEVRIDGTVLNTVQLKRALAVPAAPIIGLNSPPAEVHGDSNATPQQSFNFSTLCRAVDDKFLLAFHSGGFYLLDPGVNGVVVWSDSINGIIDAKTVRDMVYLWCNDGKLRAVTVCELDTLVVRLYLRNQYGACAALVADNKDYFTTMFRESSKFQFLPDLVKRIKENNIIVTDEVTSVLDSVTNDMFLLNQERQKALKLDSGIFLVGNDFSLTRNVFQQNAQTFSHRDALLRKQTDCNRRNGYSKDDNFLKTESETRTSSRDSSDVESTADDLDDVFQLLGITKQEMKVALKEMGNTISGTLTNSTKSVRKSLRVMMSKQKLAWASNYWNTASSGGEDEGDLCISSDGRRKSLEEWKKSPNTQINNFILACENVSNYKSSDEKRREEYIFDLLESLAYLCYRYGTLTSEEVESIVLGRRTEPDYESISISGIFSEWLIKDESNFFLFSQIFSEDIVVQIRIHLHNSLKSGTLVSWIRKNLPDDSGSSLLFPSFMRSLYNEDEFLIDRILSHFLRITAPLLDPFIILQCLSVCQSSCVFLSWNRVLELCQEGRLHKDRNTCKDIEKDAWPLPITLNAILIMLDLKQVEYCKSAPIKDIFYTILRLEARGMKNGKSELAVFEEGGTLFMEYLSALLSSKIIQCLDDIEIRTYLLTHLEQMKCFQNKFKACPCGFPQPFLKDEVENHKLPYSKVCRSLVMWLNENDKERLDDVCRANPLLWPLALCARRGEPLKTLLPTIIQMGDFLELEYRVDDMSEDMWSRVFLLCSDLGKKSCLGCSKPLRLWDKTDECDLWKRLAEFLLRKVGPAEAIRLLSNHANLLPSGVIDESFLKLCAISTLLDPTSGDLSKYMLDSISNVPRKIPNVSAFSHTVIENLNKSGITTEMLPSLDAKPKNHHWGVKINLDKATCPCCLLPLGSSVLVEKGGVAVFKCAHVFHTVCLQKRTSSISKTGCPICPPKCSVNGGTKHL